MTERNQGLLMGRKPGDAVRRLIGADHNRHPAILGASCEGVVGRHRFAAAEPAQLDVLLLPCRRWSAPWPHSWHGAATVAGCRSLCPTHRCGRRPSPARYRHRAAPLPIRSTISVLWLFRLSISLPNGTLPDRPNSPTFVGRSKPCCLGTAIVPGSGLFAVRSGNRSAPVRRSSARQKTIERKCEHGNQLLV